MKLFLHRGYWAKGFKPNSLDAFKCAFDLGHSIELDLKYSSKYNNLVVGHDILEEECLFEEVVQLHDKFPDSYMALNIKSDGILNEVQSHLAKTVQNYFCFDMSVPEYFKYSINNIPVAVRLSEFENPIFESKFYWLDNFYSNWWVESKLHIDFTKVILVSPELHQRPLLNSYSAAIEKNIFGLCLDYPERFKSSHV